MKLYTRGGDGGETGLFGGRRVRKSDLRVEAYGSVDELNALLGLVRASLTDADLDDRLATIQSALFDLGGELAAPDVDERQQKGQKLPHLGDAEISELESWIDACQAEVTPLRSFILPGGAPAAARLHHARSVCRRAERRLVELSDSGASVSERLLRYLNRLSDLLFVMARVVNHRAEVEEPPWIGRER